MKALVITLLAYGLLNPLCLCGGLAASGAFGVAAMASPHHHHHGHHHEVDASAKGDEGDEKTDDDHPHGHFHSEVKAAGPSPVDAPSLLPAVEGPMELFAKATALVSTRQGDRSRLFESGVPPPDGRHDPASSGVFLI